MTKETGNTNKTEISATDFGRILKELRRERKMSQHDLVESSGLSLRMISDMERGLKQPTLTTLFKLAKGLNISVIGFMQRLVDGS